MAGAMAKAANGSVLTAAAMDAHNTFASPKAVVPTPIQARVHKGKLVVKLPAKSVAVVAVEE
jgi:alpha-N-arabinofuranosidase